MLRELPQVPAHTTNRTVCTILEVQEGHSEPDTVLGITLRAVEDRAIPLRKYLYTVEKADSPKCLRGRRDRASLPDRMASLCNPGKTDGKPDTEGRQVNHHATVKPQSFSTFVRICTQHAPMATSRTN